MLYGYMTIYIKAELIFHEKKLLNHQSGLETAIAEIKVWKVPRSEHEEGIKYSLFLVRDGTVVIGFDNHKPKGPHFHIWPNEFKYEFISHERLLNDFWEMVQERGFLL